MWLPFCTSLSEYLPCPVSLRRKGQLKGQGAVSRKEGTALKGQGEVSGVGVNPGLVRQVTSLSFITCD